MLEERHLALLQERGLDAETVVRFGVESSERHGGDLLDRLLEKTSHDPASGCWSYTGRLSTYGYGRLKVGGKVVGLHRISFEMFKGRIPRGLQVDHLCRNRACANPGHLRAVTSGENTLAGETAAARNKQKTHCPQGHAYEGDNLRVIRGHRHCRTCAIEAKRRFRARGKRHA